VDFKGMKLGITLALVAREPVDPVNNDRSGAKWPELRKMNRLILLIVMPLAVAAQNHEIGLTLGRINGPSRTTAAGPAELGSGVALQANYGYRFGLSKKVAYSAEIHFLANGLREITSPAAIVTRDVATLYVTPGLRVKFMPLSKRLSPYVVGGAGYALYEQSHFRQDAAPNQAPRFTHRGALMFGGGVDAPVWRWLGVRLEARDFYSGNPSLNVPVMGGGQHNVVLGGGFVISLGGARE
jgi:opacity protein-like surface antigen